MSFEKIAAIVALIATIPVYKGWAVKAWQWNKERKVMALEKRLEFITRLRTEKDYLAIYIGQSLLIVLALIAGSQVYEVMDLAAESNGISSGFISLVSLIAYFVAVYKLGILTKVRKFEETREKMLSAINKLKPNDSSK